MPIDDYHAMVDVNCQIKMCGENNTRCRREGVVYHRNNGIITIIIWEELEICPKNWTMH